jgi:D-arginine dehydrogenase
MFDFIVMGAGIAGASLSYELSRSGRVCLIEADERPGMHSTARSAALFAPSYGGREIRALTRASYAFFAAPPAGFAETPLLRDRGCLYIARADQTSALTAMCEELRTSGGEIVDLDVETCMQLVPLLRPGYVAAAALDRHSKDIEVDSLHRGFLRGARKAGAELKVGFSESRITRRDEVWKVEQGSDSVEAPVLINAAGAWADALGAQCGTRSKGLEPYRRTAILVDAPPGVDIRSWPTVIDAEEDFYFKPESGRLMLSPADETPDRPGDAQPDEIDMAVAIERVTAALAIEVRRIAHRWAGLRTFAADRVPVVGFDPDIEGFFWCAGQGGYGIQTAPALSRAAAALVTQRSIPEDIMAQGLSVERLSPARFDT